ncbi:MAG: Ig-like domain-containing protein [Eubacteriales bacterium]|nr:Ig-like domain-containing protein [Eubacteriales bacterium]
MSRKITKKRMIAFIVSLSMVASMIPAMAFGAVTGVSLNKSKLTMETESTYTLTATVTVDAEEAQTVTWSSDDESVATVEDGVVTAVSEGTADITATSDADSEKMSTCRVTVYDTALTIVLGTRADPIVVKEFNDADIAGLSSSGPFLYGGFNHFFTWKSTGGDTKSGPSIETIFEAAGIDVDAIDDDTVISFIPSDDTNGQYTANFTKAQLFADRYYYRYSSELEQGAFLTSGKEVVRTKVETIIGSDGRHYFGQVGCNERTWGASSKNMTTGAMIVIGSKAEKTPSDVRANKKSGSTIQPGAEIVLDSPGILSNDIYYTTDGKTPTMEKSQLYNYLTKGDDTVPFQTRTINAPLAEGTFTVKTLSVCYGKTDSDVQTFTYEVSRLPEVGKTYTVGRYKYKVTKTGETGGKVAFAGMTKKTYKKAVIPAKVKIKGYSFDVTAINKNALRKYTKLTKVTIGSNVTKIGSRAFYGDKKLKSIVVKGKKITKTYKAAFKGINKTAKIKVPKSKLKKYKKIFKNKGQAKTVRIIK